MAPDDAQRQKITECIAAMGALQDQLCGMFAALDQQEKTATSAVSGIVTETGKLAATIAAVPEQISSAVQANSDALLAAVKTEMENQIAMGLGAAVTEAQKKVAASVGSLKTSIGSATTEVENLKAAAAKRWWMAALLPAVAVASIVAGGFGLSAYLGNQIRNQMVEQGRLSRDIEILQSKAWGVALVEGSAGDQFIAIPASAGEHPTCLEKNKRCFKLK